MPLGIVNKDAFEAELAKLEKREAEIIIHDIVNLGRGHKPATPDVVRKVIGEEVIESGNTNKELAKIFNVSPSSVSAYANGATSTASYHKPNKSLKNHIDAVKDKIAVKARNRLIQALDSITPDKLSEASLRDSASVAKDMSSIIKDMTREKGALIGNAERVLIFQPRLKEEDDYQVLHVNE